MCKIIFDNLQELLESKASGNSYLRNMVNTTLDDLKTISVTAQQEALRSWFKDVIRSMEVMSQ